MITFVASWSRLRHRKSPMQPRFSSIESSGANLVGTGNGQIGGFAQRQGHLKQRWPEFNSEADHLVEKHNNTVGDLVWNVLCLFVSGLNSLSELPKIVWVRGQFWGLIWPPSWGKRNPKSKKITFLNYSVHAWSSSDTSECCCQFLLHPWSNVIVFAIRSSTDLLDKEEYMAPVARFPWKLPACTWHMIKLKINSLLVEWHLPNQITST